jgi:hypothetical protein
MADDNPEWTYYKETSVTRPTQMLGMISIEQFGVPIAIALLESSTAGVDRQPGRRLAFGVPPAF